VQDDSDAAPVCKNDVTKNVEINNSYDPCVESAVLLRIDLNEEGVAGLPDCENVFLSCTIPVGRPSVFGLSDDIVVLELENTASGSETLPDRPSKRVDAYPMFLFSLMVVFCEFVKLTSGKMSPYPTGVRRASRGCYPWKRRHSELAEKLCVNEQGNKAVVAGDICRMFDRNRHGTLVFIGPACKMKVMVDDLFR